MRACALAVRCEPSAQCGARRAENGGYEAEGPDPCHEVSIMTTGAAVTGERSAATAGARAVGAPFAIAPIDCDIHPAGPGIRALLPYLDEVWRDMIALRGIDRLALNLTSYATDAPATVRPDWRVPGGRPGSDIA